MIPSTFVPNMDELEFCFVFEYLISFHVVLIYSKILNLIPVQFSEEL